MHVILLDNGRTHVLADRLGRQALRCIRCSACLNVCPVYERTGGHAYGSVYPGPIGAVLNPQLRGTASEIDQSLPYASSLCGACFDACPVRINIPELLVELRGTVAQQGGHRAESAAMKAAAWVLSDPKRLAGAQRAATTAGRIIGKRTIRSVPGLGAWTNARDLPTPPTETFRQWWVREHGSEHGQRVTRSEQRNGGRRAMSARDEILARVRAAVADVTTEPGARGTGAGHQASSPGVSETVELFAENVADYRATVIRRPALTDGARHRRRRRGAVDAAAARSWCPRASIPRWVQALAGVATVSHEADAATHSELDAVDAVVTGLGRGHRDDRHDHPRPRS